MEFFKQNNNASAVFCSNYELTLGTIMALNELGMKFPEDVSVIGFDNMELTGVIKPSLTIIEQPMEQIARLAAELLLKRLEQAEKQEYEVIILGAKLVEGESVADLR